MRPLILICITVLPAICQCPEAWASIYSYTGPDGTVHLSNHPGNGPSDKHYTLLIADQAEPGEVVPLAAGRKWVRTAVDKAGYDQLVDRAAHQYGLESELLHAVISVESRYNPKAVSRKGAMGLMQLMPDTARRYGVVDAFNPEQNVSGGAQYLRDLLQKFNSDISLALAAYNSGENTVVRSGNRIPAIKETADYVPRVLGFYHDYLDDSHPGGP